MSPDSSFSFLLFAGELCRSKKVFFHTDAAQAIGKVPVNVEEQKIDLLSISGHKIYGPKGNKEKVAEKALCNSAMKQRFLSFLGTFFFFLLSN